MKLKDWLRKSGTPLRSFALRIGVANGSVVKKYADGRVPRARQVREAIVRETGGQVQMDDIYAAVE